MRNLPKRKTRSSIECSSEEASVVERRLTPALLSVVVMASCSSPSEARWVLLLNDGTCFAVESEGAVFGAAHCELPATVRRATSGEEIAVTGCRLHPDASLGRGTDLMRCQVAGSPAGGLPTAPANVGESWFVARPRRWLGGVDLEPLRDQRRLGIGEWEVGAPPGTVCPGDSGLPVVVQRGPERTLAVVGLVSARYRQHSCEQEGPARIVSFERLADIGVP